MAICLYCNTQYTNPEEHQNHYEERINPALKITKQDDVLDKPVDKLGDKQDVIPNRRRTMEKPSQ